MEFSLSLLKLSVSLQKCPHIAYVVCVFVSCVIANIHSLNIFESSFSAASHSVCCLSDSLGVLNKLH